jgi:2-succinyl-6-hydroxy-2,4-cyclohexadiene-1-carboxylate synthase
MPGLSVVMLHGFGGTARAFDGVIAALPPERYTPIALDLPGHGARGAPDRPITYERCTELVLAHSPSRFVLCGYSMGARIALRAALAAPQRVSRLVLVSATAGIESESERQARHAADLRLAAQIESEPMERFVARWRNQPMFAQEPAAVRELACADHRRNTTAGIAAALRAIGSGAMPPLWDRLGELDMPVVVLAGERDAKYRALGEQIAAATPQGKLRVLAGGHGLLLENPVAVAQAISDPF